MPYTSDLMGVGVTAEHANRLGFHNAVGLFGSGTTQNGATEIVATNNNVTAQTEPGNTAFRLSADRGLFDEVFVACPDADGALVYPPAGGWFDDGAVDAPVVLEQNVGRIFWRVEEGFWSSMVAGTSAGGVDSVTAGTGIAVDNTDPHNPVVSNTGVLSVTAGTNVTITGTAQNPVINSSNPGGTVTSVGLAAPADFLVTNSPVTSTGTLTLAWTTTPTGTGAVVRAVSPALTGTPTAPTAAVNTNTTQIATTAMVLGQAASATPLGNAATAVVGTSTRYARADHVHPGREVLTGARTYYVATTGSDSNNGLSALTPFLTIQRAIDVALGTLDFGGYNVTIQVATGTYTGTVRVDSAQVGAGQFLLQGDTTTPSNVVISTTSATAVQVSGFGSRLRLAGLKIQTTTSGSGVLATNGGEIIYSGNMEFGACVTWTQLVNQNGILRRETGNFTVSGGSNALINGNSAGVVILQGGTWTLTGTPNFAQGTVRAADAAYVNVALITFSGSATGQRYNVNTSATIFTNGGGASYIPGNSAGTDNSGEGHYT